MKSFLQAAEIWTPDETGTTLTLAEGLYGDLDSFRTASAEISFAYDEGLPGKAWAQRHPIILKEFKDSYFKRTDAARAVGLTCGIALPIFAGDALQAVVVFFCGDDQDRVGVIEVWKHDPLRSPGIRLDDGYFGVAEALEWNARHITFMPGNGLPGMVWLRNRPMFLADLGDNFQFLRPDDARQVGLTKGLGIPCPGDPANVWVLLFLSALGTPIAQRQEVWRVEDDGAALSFIAGGCERQADLGAAMAGVTISAGHGAIGEALSSGVPQISRDLRGDRSAASASAAAAGLASMIAIPTYQDGAVTAVAALYF